LRDSCIHVYQLRTSISCWRIRRQLDPCPICATARTFCRYLTSGVDVLSNVATV